MPRHASTYRAARRNAWHGDAWPSRIAARALPPAPVRPNERDRSDEAEVKRKESLPTIDFTGAVGLARAQIAYRKPTLHQKKPKRGWAAKRRRAPFRDAFDPVRMAKIAARHVHPRRWRKVA